MRRIKAAKERRHRLIVIDGDCFLQETIPDRDVLFETENGTPLFFVRALINCLAGAVLENPILRLQSRVH